MADITRSNPHIIEDLLGTDGTGPRVKAILKVNGVATSNPTDTTALANASAINAATVACTGAAVGDIVLGFGVVSGLATNQVPVGAYVSATDVVTILVGNLVNTTVTTTAMTVNVLVADVT
jgi:hypothetical protein